MVSLKKEIDGRYERYEKQHTTLAILEGGTEGAGV